MQELAEQTGIRLEILQGIIASLKKAGATRAVLYGSRARGDFSDPSDIDIAYWGDANETELWLAMGELPTVHKVDLVRFDRLTNPALKQNILRDGRSILEH